jgi:FixJ family two-component response regulator
MDGTARTVFVVDGCWDSRLRLSHELTSAGYRVRSFQSAEHFLAAQDAKTPGCVLLDVVLPGMSGLDLQCALVGSACPRPLVFLTGQGDVRASVQAMKAGAIDFLTKPISNVRVFEAVEQAVQCDAEQRQTQAICSVIQTRLETLTQRELQVMTWVIQGRLNKQIAAGIGTGVKTVKVHRGRVMSKMGARSVAELVRLGAQIGAALEPTLAANSRRLTWQLAFNAEEWKPHPLALTQGKSDGVVLTTDRWNESNGAVRHLNVFQGTDRVGVSAPPLGGSEETVSWAAFRKFVSRKTRLPYAGPRKSAPFGQQLDVRVAASSNANIHT